MSAKQTFKAITLRHHNTALTRRTVFKALGFGLLSSGSLKLLTASQQVLANESVQADLSHVHPELREMAPGLLKMSNEYEMTPEFIRMVREAGGGPQKPFRDDIPVEEKKIPGAKGHPEVLVYIINASADKARPAILHMHGGGYVLGSAKDSVRDMQDLAEELDCAVVTVDYRLAPEHRYTDSIEDNYTALKWLHSNAKKLGVIAEKIALMGESAGGGHAALLALTARDRGEVPVLFQCLVYPMLDDRTGSSREVPAHIGTIGWTAESNIFGWQSFLGEQPGTDKVPVAAVPARVADLSGLPPAFIGVGGIDLFVDEDIEYAQRLVDAGVPTQLLVQTGAFHGFDVWGAQTPIGKRFTAAKIDALRRAFDGQFN